jgi:hypothetical protein
MQIKREYSGFCFAQYVLLPLLHSQNEEGSTTSDSQFQPQAISCKQSLLPIPDSPPLEHRTLIIDLLNIFSNPNNQ